MTFEPGGSIAKLPADGARRLHRRRSPTRRARRRRRPSAGWRGSGTSRRRRRRGQGFSADVRGTFVPDATGDWEFGVRAVGPVTVLLDGEPVVRSTRASTAARSSAWAAPRSAARSSSRRGGRYELASTTRPVRPTSGCAASSSAPAPVQTGDHIERAVAVATGADVAIVVVGTDDDWETEGEDRTGLALPARPGRAGGRRRRRQPEHRRRAEHRLAGDDAVARRRRRPCCRCGSPARRSATPSPTSSPATPSRAAGCRSRIRPASRTRRRSPPTPGATAAPSTPRGCSSGTAGTTARTSSRCSRSGTGSATRRSSCSRRRSSGGVEPGVTVEVTCATPAGATAARSCRSTSSRRPATRPARSATSPASPAPTSPPARRPRSPIELDRRAFASWIDGDWVVPPGEHVIHVGRHSRDLRARRRRPILTQCSARAAPRRASAETLEQPPVDRGRGRRRRGRRWCG